MAKFKHTFGQKCEIELLGLWDTVSTIGWLYKPIYFPFTTNNESVKAVRHVLSIDEKRIFFRPLLWGQKYKNRQDIKEVWFSGTHSDVGGGYTEEESGLAKITLNWMVNEILSKRFKILINEQKFNRYVLGKNSKGKYIAPCTNAEVHDSLDMFWSKLQFIPMLVWDGEKKSTKINFIKPYRIIGDGAHIHRSVVEKLEIGNYSPKNIDKERLNQYIISE